MVVAPPIASIWVLPRESRDGKSIIEGVWIHTMLDEARWGLTKTMEERAIPLRAATNMAEGSNGELEMRVVVSDRLRSTVKRIGSLTTRMPYSVAAPGTVQPNPPATPAAAAPAGP
jgi:hypothetical protein